MGRLNVPQDLKHDMWTYSVLYSVKWKYWNVPCRENVILAYLINFINGKVECASWFRTWYMNIFCFEFGKLKVLEWPLRKNEILAYRLLSLRNKKVELVPWFKTWYVRIFCFVFGKMKVLECSLSRKRDFSLFGKFYKWEGWICP